MADIVKGQIGNALESVAPDGIVATADAIYDETKGKYQEQINAEVGDSLNAQYHNTGYYECGTAAATAAKTVTASGYQLPATAPYGGSIKVKFTNKNSAANPTLSINQSTPKPLYYNGAIASASNTWDDNDVLDLYYDGTNFNAKSVVEKFATGEKVKNVGIDNEPTANSNNLIKSGGVDGLLKHLNELTLKSTNDTILANSIFKKEVQQLTRHIGGVVSRYSYTMPSTSTASYGCYSAEVNAGEVFEIAFNNVYSVSPYASLVFANELTEGTNIPCVLVGDVYTTSQFTNTYYFTAPTHGYLLTPYFNNSHASISKIIGINVIDSPIERSDSLVKSDGIKKSELDIIFDRANQVADTLFLLAKLSQETNDISSSFVFKRGYFVGISDKKIYSGGASASYGSFQIPVSRGELYLFEFKYTINDSAYSNYSGLAFHKQDLESSGYVEYNYMNCVGTGKYSKYFLAPEDGYISAFTISNSSSYYPTAYKINKSEISFKGLKDAGFVTIESLSIPNSKSKSFMNYIRWAEGSGNVSNNVAPLESDIFEGNVSRISIGTNDVTFPTGCFHSDIYGDTAWVNVLKQYQTQDGGTPLKLYLKARIYNSGASNANTIHFGVRYKEGGDWILPGADISIPSGEYKDVEISFTPNYNALTTVIDSFILFSNCNGAVLEFGNWDLYVIDPKARNSEPYINPVNIESGITLEQLSPSVQHLIENNSANHYPSFTKKIVCSGSSITWGGGALDDSMVKFVDKYLKERLASTITSEQMEFSGESEIVNNALLYNGVGRMISTIGETVEFDMYGDEIAICQMKRRNKNAYGIINVYADDVLIGCFDNKNFIRSESENFSGSSLVTIQLKHPCTFNHVIKINGSSTPLTKVVYNTGGYGGHAPSDPTVFDAFVFRALDTNGHPVHRIEFSSALGDITSVEITYDYGNIVAHERSTVGQTDNEYTNESYYGKGTTSYDPDAPAGGIDSGMEFRAINENAFFIHKFTSATSRHYKIELVDGIDPYFIINYATNRYHDLMNAGIGGWTVGQLINDDKICDYTQFYKWFKPDIILQESETNDDWEYQTRRIRRSIGEITLSQLRELPWLEIYTVTYNDQTDKYAVEMCTGIIDSITYTSLISSHIVGTNTQVGDIIRIGNYHGDIKETVCRKITEVNLTTGEVKWVEPLVPSEILNINTIDDLVGAEINIRDLSGYKNRYKTYIQKVHEITPEATIVVVNNGLPMLGARQLWGYDIIHREIVSETTNTKYLDAREILYKGQFETISGTRKEVITSDGSSSYDLAFVGSNKSWYGFKVLVNGIDVYGKGCYIQSQYMYRAKRTLIGASLNKSQPYSRSNADYDTSDTNIKMQLVFTENAPTANDTIEVLFSDTIWSGDFCHPSEFGSFLYGQAYSSVLNS